MRPALLLLLVFVAIDVATATVLQTVLCSDKCKTDCMAYSTPMEQCYNGQALFPHDESWSDFDIYDQLLDNDNDSIQRSFYASSNGTCAGDATDGFVLPLNTCVGPFGEPRPWGTLILMQ